MSTAFSIQDFAAIDPFVSVHKIASYEISHLRLLELTARTGKPTILSTGASTVSDVSWAVQTLTDNGCGDLCLMQCTAKYPAPLPSLNLDVLPYLARRYGVATGLSDHSRHPVYGPATAVALGARCIEKHYTLSNRLPGADHAFALTPDELKEMVQSIRAVEQTLGSGIKTVLDDEKELAAYARRGLQATRNIAAGEPLREGENIAILRPGSQRLGIHPRYLSHLEGKRAKRAIALGDGILRSDWDA